MEILDHVYQALPIVSGIVEEHFLGLQIAVLVVALSLLVYWTAIHPYYFLQKYGIPHPKITPFFGNVLDVLKPGGTNKLHKECIKRFGKVYGYYMGRRPVICVADPELLEQIFVKEFSNFHNRPAFITRGRPPMNMGLLLADYPDWRRIRPTVSPTFSAGKIKQMIPLLEKSINTLASILSESAEKGDNIEVFGCFGRLTMEVIMSVAFGLDNEFQREGNNKITNDAAKFFVISKLVVLVELFPLPTSVKTWIKHLALADPTYLLGLLKPVVEERKKKPSNRKDFLQLLLSENKTDGKPKLTDDDIYASCITFLLAGYETTSNALAYTTYLLALHPEIQERLYQEVKDVIKGKEQASIYDDIQKLEYLDAVLNESLRMYPPAWQTARLIEHDCTIGKYTFPGNVGLQIPIFAIHHCEEFWEEPDKFDPERFSPENKGKINPYHYMPFGHGPRNCVGLRFALVEAKITLIKLLQRFRFVKTEETEAHPLELRYGVTMSPKNGIKLKIVQR